MNLQFFNLFAGCRIAKTRGRRSVRFQNVRLAALLILWLLPINAATPAAFDWVKLSNPVLQYPNWSIKDATVVERAGLFHVFFDAAYEDDGRIRFHVVEVTTRDFKNYSAPVLNFYGKEDGWIGMASPDVYEHEGVYYLTFNSWGDKERQPNQLFYMTSPDLKRWSARRPLAANLTRGLRAIDAAVAFANGRVYLIYKEKQAARIAVANKIDGAFKLIGDGAPRFQRAGGALAKWHENFQFIKLDGQWRMMTTGERHDPFLYRMERNGARDEDWLAWTDGYGLEIVVEDFNTDERANSAALMDWRAKDGYFYLLYAGRSEGQSYLKRGWNRLALSRSRDLRVWLPAGKAGL